MGLTESCGMCRLPFCLRTELEADPELAKTHVVHQGRGLCKPCYHRARYHGTLEDYARRYYTSDELLEEWVLLRAQGCDIKQAAPRLGLSYTGLAMALLRARHRGDERGAVQVPQEGEQGINRRST